MQTDRIKIAVLIVGEYRTFPYCYKTMYFLHQPENTGIDVDLYISTWSRTRTTNPPINCGGGVDITPNYIDVTEDDIRNVITRDAVIKVHPYLENNHTFQLMHHGWYLGFKLIEDSGNIYDYVYVMRPDLFYRQPSFFMNPFDTNYDNSIGVITPNSADNLSDCEFFSTYDNIKRLLSSDIFELDSTIGEIHQIWYEYVINKGLHLTTLPFEIKDPSNIGRFPMNDNSTWDEVSQRYWDLFHKRVIL